MKYAINIINFGDCGDAQTLADLAVAAEEAGWDGFYIWDHIAFPFVMPMADPWIALTAIAMRTTHIRIGAMVTPLPRRRPWKFARETVTLDRLSQGRLTVGIGLGVNLEEFDHLGEESDLRRRGAMLDEALDVVTGLWTGQSFSYSGEHYTVTDATFLPVAQQEPRIPIWVAGAWPNKPPFRRAARWDGVFPIPRSLDPDAVLSTDEVREMAAYIAQYRQSDRPFDITIAAGTPGDDAEAAAATSAAYADAGVTWWQEVIHGLRPDLVQRAAGSSMLAAMEWRIRQGPPRH